MGLLPSVKSTLIVMFSIFIPALCSANMLNCSQSNQLALLKVLTPIFDLTAIRPVQNLTTCTDVYTFFTLYGIVGVSGTGKISLPATKFCVPDIVIHELMEENKAPPAPFVYLYSNGKVTDCQHVKIVSVCNLNIDTFPFDVQNCIFTCNHYTHYAEGIKIFLGRPAEKIIEISKNVMTTMGEWELLEITSHKNKDSDTDNDSLYVDNLKIHIRVRRQSTMYVVNLLLPSCFLITADFFSFLLPPQSVDKSAFKMTLILGYTVFLLIMNDLLPTTGNTIPLINVFFSIHLALMVASLLETIFITNLLCGSADCPVPHWIKVVILQFLSFLVCMSRLTKKPRASEIDLETRTVVAKCEDFEGPPETRGSALEDSSVQELKNLHKDLQAIRLQVEQQKKGSQSSEELMQCCPLKVKPSKLLFTFISLLMHAQSSSSILHCSQPDPTSLLETLKPVYNLSAIRPVTDISTTTNVSIQITIYGILGVDEKAQLLTTFIWEDFTWENEFTSWDPEECGSRWISVPRKYFWVPDIVINEFMDENTAPFVPYCYLSSDGFVLDSKPAKVISSCRLDIYLFPFDIQNCTLSFNSYSLKSDELQLYLPEAADRTFERSKKYMAIMGEWELIGITVKKNVFPSSAFGTYDELRFHVSIRRRALLYVVNLLLPSCFLITVDLFSFILPPKNVDRSLFKMTLILGYTVFLLIMNDLLPITGNTIPLINVFLSLCLAMMVASLLETIFVTNLLHGSSHYPRAPRWIRVFLLDILGRLLCLHSKRRNQEDTVIQNPATQMEVPFPMAEGSKTLEQKSPLNEDETLQELRILGKDLQAIRLKVEQHLSKSQSTEEWIQIGFIIDRLLFILYILFISVSFITIIIIWVNSYNAS